MCFFTILSEKELPNRIREFNVYSLGYTDFTIINNIWAMSTKSQLNHHARIGRGMIEGDVFIYTCTYIHKNMRGERIQISGQSSACQRNAI